MTHTKKSHTFFVALFISAIVGLGSVSAQSGVSQSEQYSTTSQTIQLSQVGSDSVNTGFTIESNRNNNLKLIIISSLIGVINISILLTFSAIRK